MGAKMARHTENELSGEALMTPTPEQRRVLRIQLAAARKDLEKLQEQIDYLWRAMGYETFKVKAP